MPPDMPPRTQLHSQRTTAAAATLTSDNDHTPNCNVDISSDPFVDTQTIKFTSRGRHRTKGIILKDSTELDATVVITTCRPGTAATKILNWRKRLKGSTLLKVNNIPITSSKQAEKILNEHPNMTDITITVGIQEKLPMHDDNGIPIMYFDQLATIATHLQQIITVITLVSLIQRNQSRQTNP
jgi:hypothetical protein